MRNLLAFLAAAGLTFAGLGWYLGWYRIDNVSTVPGRHQFNIDIDGKKISEDVHKGAERSAEKLQNFLEKNRGGEPNEEECSLADEPKPSAP